LQEQKFGKVEFYSFEKGVEEAKKHNKTMFIYFRSDYCSWCRKFAEEVLTNASVVDRLKESFIPVAVDVDNEKDLLHQFDVFGTPTIVFVDSNGKELKKLVGFINAGDFLGVLDEVAGPGG
ncbi:MAG: thioredoxin fold domain-containing protein, partial [Candidatus Hydrothermarchaeota archaeon]